MSNRLYKDDKSFFIFIRTKIIDSINLPFNIQTIFLDHENLKHCFEYKLKQKNLLIHCNYVLYLVKTNNTSLIYFFCLIKYENE